MNGNGNNSSSPSSPSFSTSSNDYADELSAGLADIEEGMTERKKQRVRASRYKPFPATDQLIPYRHRSDLNFDVNDVPTHVESIFLAFLHCFVMLGSTVAVPTVIVPLMGGGKEEKAHLILNFIFAAGITTLLHSYVGTRLPVVMGSSYAYLIPAISVAMSKSFGKNDHDQFKDSIRAIQGSLMAAGIFQIVFPFTGALRVYWRFLNPVTIVPLVTLTGFGVLAFGFPKLLLCAEVGLPSLAILVLLSLTLPYMLRSQATLFNNNKWLRWMLRSDGTIFRRYSIVLSAGFLWLISAIFSVAHYYEKRSVDAQHCCDARHTWLVDASPGFVFPSPWHWGTPTFNLGDYFAAMSAAFVVIIESSGALIAASRYGGATPIPPHIFLRGTICQGVSTVVASVFGVTGCTVSVENVGLLGLTGVGSRRVIRISAWVMMLISVIGKFGSFLASIPLSVVAAWNLMLHGYVVGAGLSYLQFGNHNRYRSLWIVGFSISIGVSVPAFFRRYLATHGQSSSTAFHNIILVMCSSQATVSVLSGMLLDLMYTGRDVLSIKQSSGRHWFKRFRHYNRAARTADYYSAPCNLPEGFPQV